MAKIKYYYDTDTCQYQEVRTSTADTMFMVSAFLIASLIMAAGLTILYNSFFPSDKYLQLERENKVLSQNYKKFENDMVFVHKVLDAIQERDDYLYRGYFDSEPLSQTIRQGGTGGTDRYRELPKSEVIRKTAFKIEQVRKRLYIQGKSFDELVKLARTHSERASAIPGIMPIAEATKRFASGFGMRMHPIYRIFKKHTGCDFSAPIGTPVYSTGDGVVVGAGVHSGYGNQVAVDHGYGFVSTYSHLSAYSVKVGQKVKRGQQIGKVGSTGVSVSPHLHYEIERKGVKVDPIHYFYDDLNPHEFEELVEVAGHNRPSMGN